ncbi:FAD-dependent oxidoreductase [Nonomuraea sp. NPDC003727]
MTTPALPVVVIGAGQSGLAAARAILEAGLRPLVLEVGPRPAGAWPDYYDSLTLFSPARFSAMPGLDFDGDPDRYPHRDEVVDYLARYAAGLDAEIRTGTRVEAVEQSQDGRFVVRTADGQELEAAGVVAASGSFSRPILPALPGAEPSLAACCTRPTTAARRIWPGSVWSWSAVATPPCRSPTSWPRSRT